MDDSDRAVTTSPVIPAKAGIQPRWFGLAVLASLLVLVGAGCETLRSEDEAWRLSGIQFDKLTFEDAGDRSYVEGLRTVCSIENAKILFAKNINWSEVEKTLDAKKAEGWKLKQFCYRRGSVPYFLFSKQNKAQQEAFLIGAYDPSNGPIFADPYEPDILDGKWNDEWILDMDFTGQGMDFLRITAVGDGEGSAFAWRAALTFYPVQRELSTSVDCRTEPENSKFLPASLCKI